MPNTPIDDKRFSDREVREILKKAVEDASPGALVKRDGLTLSELKAIGKEVGIDPARLDAAARTVASRDVRRWSRILGVPAPISIEQKVQGEFTAEDTPEVLALIRRTMGRHGEADQVGGSLEWSAKGETGGRYVTVSSKGGTTTVSGSANLSNLALVTYVPAGLAGLFATIMGAIQFSEGGGLVGLVAGLAVLPILYSLLRAILSRITKSESAKLEQVVDELARLAEKSVE